MPNIISEFRSARSVLDDLVRSSRSPAFSSALMIRGKFVFPAMIFAAAQMNVRFSFVLRSANFEGRHLARADQCVKDVGGLPLDPCRNLAVTETTSGAIRSHRQ